MNEKMKRKWNRLKRRRVNCPHCMSARAELVHAKRRFTHYWIQCCNCHDYGPQSLSINGAIRKWNREAVKIWRLE